MGYYIDVILPLPLEKTFTYSISKAEADYLQSGMRVAVPFGKSKIYTALVYKIHQTPPEVYEAKEIDGILDDSPIVTATQLKLWNWMASYYLCSVGNVLQAALPNAFLLQSETIIKRNLEQDVDEVLLKDDEYLVYEALQQQSLLRVQEIVAITGKKNVLPVIKRLFEKKVVLLEEEIYEKYIPKKVRYVRLADQYSDQDQLRDLLETLKRAPKQKAVLLELFQHTAQEKEKAIAIPVLSKKSGGSTTSINSLVEKEILIASTERIDRITYESNGTQGIKQLNESQQKALEGIRKAFLEKKVTLLHGVTASGKTEVYAQLIKKALDERRQVLYLLPEIALTAQLIKRLQHYFGDKVITYHSKFSANERVEIWNNIYSQDHQGKLIVGARSAVFLPFNRLDLILVDEEHETSFKQFDPAPRYHTRDTAIVLANLHDSNILLGSATPALESYYNTEVEKFAKVSITERYGGVIMPEISLVSIKEKNHKKLMKGHFSDELIAEISECIARKKQVILFQNRRGFAPITECTTCGHAPQCPNCDVSLTYHQYQNQLRCHYCGYNMANPVLCIACGSNELTNKGFGTEQVEEELRTLFPEAKVARMDQDTTRGKHSHEKLIRQFEDGLVQIMVGTQMLAKGLDFKNVYLVGVMNADALLNFPDFRAYERSFQLLMQVAGRAGRAEEQGKVLIQTYNPLHPILQQVASHNYKAMYKDQKEERQLYKYPPFYRLIRFTFKHKDFNRTLTASEWFAKSMQNVFRENVLGPESPPVARIRNQYHKNVLLKIPQNQSLDKTKAAIRRIRKTFSSIKDFSGVRVIMDVDCY